MYREKPRKSKFRTQNLETLIRENQNLELTRLFYHPNVTDSRLYILYIYFVPTQYFLEF